MAPVRTALDLGNSNCTWCLNNAVDDLRGREEVTGVVLDAGRGCLAVEHDGGTAALVAVVRSVLRGSEQADNGEEVMVDLDVRERPGCGPGPGGARAPGPACSRRCSSAAPG